ncbi:hypothetical protein [Gymnodinialimonas ceratoperidinii]|uniref:Uncharacterized protein n=1 Tax=Gymnodinialimonas ceratoperidinii TaxID=2856823 RepID=A0A8F6TUF3_9RHOB|nr:hypothetical protein [Gymnodinialimonas ceratoperidinii]QXT38915.1 hypothetical protein KYE46_13360 [Gymnodinialimonas ceratoperidinii]
MIPTLSGRLQTRIFLFLVIGLPITILFGMAQAGWRWDWSVVQIYLWFLCAVVGMGLLFDPLYIFAQSLRWERDWPFAFQAFFSWVEFGVVYFLARAGLVPFLPETAFQSLGTPALHFALVFVPSFLVLLGPMQVLFLRWRFKGGQFGKL